MGYKSKCKAESINIQRKNVGKDPCDPELEKDFLGLSQKQKLLLFKDTSKRMKRKVTEWEKNLCKAYIL